MKKKKKKKNILYIEYIHNTHAHKVTLLMWCVVFHHWFRFIVCGMCMVVRFCYSIFSQLFLRRFFYPLPDRPGQVYTTYCVYSLSWLGLVWSKNSDFFQKIRGCIGKMQKNTILLKRHHFLDQTKSIKQAGSQPLKTKFYFCYRILKTIPKKCWALGFDDELAILIRGAGWISEGGSADPTIPLATGLPLNL